MYDYSVQFGLDVLSKQIGSMGVETQPSSWELLDAVEYHRLRDQYLDAIHTDLGINV